MRTLPELFKALSDGIKDAKCDDKLTEEVMERVDAHLKPLFTKEEVQRMQDYSAEEDALKQVVRNNYQFGDMTEDEYFEEINKINRIRASWR